jgi:hypothetical protein
LLGPATAFEAIPNEALQATLVDIRLGAERRVLLVSIQPDGTPLLEDLTGQLARAAGRGPMSALDGVRLDLNRFRRDGQIGVVGLLEDRGAAKADVVNVGQQITQARAERGGPTAQD